MDKENHLKEVGGLSNRLCHLEHIMQDAKSIVAEQKNLADCFQRVCLTYLLFKHKHILVGFA